MRAFFVAMESILVPGVLVRSFIQLSQISRNRSFQVGKDFDVLYYFYSLVNIIACIGITAKNASSIFSQGSNFDCNPKFIVFTYTIQSAVCALIAINWAEIAGKSKYSANPKQENSYCQLNLRTVKPRIGFFFFFLNLCFVTEISPIY